MDIIKGEITIFAKTPHNFATCVIYFVEGVYVSRVIINNVFTGIIKDGIRVCDINSRTTHVMIRTPHTLIDEVIGIK